MRYTGPKNRLARREGVDLGLKTPGTKTHSNLLRRLSIIPGQRNNTKKRRKLSDYGIQLREKQKLKRMYGLTDRQMKIYFEKAIKRLGNTADFLIQHLETRLDNIVYRLGFAPTRASARQLINHGHFAVNGKKVSIPSYNVNINDTVSFKKEKSAAIPYIAQVMEKKDLLIPSYLERKGALGKLIAYPKNEDIADVINLQQVIEFYSR